MGNLVLGATGTVGSAVVAELLRRGEPVRAVTRSRDRAAELPDGAEPVVGDLQDPATFDSIFRGVDRLFLLNAVTDTELQEGLAAVNEARRHGAARVVYVSVQDVERGPHVPHFASKIAVERALRESGVPHVVLRPSNFHQNDLWYRDVLLEHGVYPQPLGGRGVSRVDVRDIATAAANALGGRGDDGAVYALVGPDALTGEETASIWSDALGREVRYGGDDLDAWQAQALQMLPAWMVYDLRLMYAMFQEKGLAATDEQLRQTEEIVGAAPRPFRDFAREAAAEWT